VDRERADLTPAKPVTLSWTNADGQRFEQIVAVDDGYLFTVEQRVVNARASRSRCALGLVSRAAKSPDPTAGPTTSARSAFGGKANYDVDWKDARRGRPATASRSTAAAAGSASPTNIG
jgi:YidC/Oxa1 family membrane protein insertase